MLQVWLEAMGFSSPGGREARLFGGKNNKNNKNKNPTSQNLLLAISAKPLNLHGLFWHRHVLSAGGCGRQP